jgi:hypothetical protein
LRRPGVLAALLGALTAAACLLPGSAFAIEQRSVVESFGPDGTSGTSFERPGALSFDQGNKRLYALDLETQKIHGYSVPSAGTHTPLGGSFPLTAPGAGFADDIGVNSSTHNLYFASVGENELFGFNESGSGLSGFPVAGQNFPCGVATDSSSDIWVAEANEGKLRKYSPAGALLETIVIGGEPCDLAIDSNDNIYVSFFFGATKKYTAASSYTSSSQIDSEASSAVAVDPSTDEVYVAHSIPFPNPSHISVYEADGSFLYEFGKAVAAGEAEFAGVAIDSATEQVYASAYDDSFAKKILVFGVPLLLPRVKTEGADAITATTATVHGTINPKGQAVEDCHFEVVPVGQFGATGYGAVTPAEKFPCVPAAGTIPVDKNVHPVSANVSGLTFASIYHYRLVAKNAIGEAQGLDRNFISGPVAPLMKEQIVEAVGTGEVTLSAKINPNGADTTYLVEYGTSSSYGQSTPESAPIGDPADTTYHTVSVHIGGLAPATAYHFRFVATSDVGTAAGPDTSFATYSQAAPTFAPCSNDQFRTGPGARLPDCRAYEQATPIDKHGANAQGQPGLIQASPSGDRVDFFTNGGMPTTGGSANLYPFIASRGPGGWSSDGMLPLTSPGFRPGVIGWSEDLGTVFGVEPVEDNPNKSAYYLRDSDTATFQRGPTADTFTARLESSAIAGFAADQSHLIFENESVQLLPNAVADVDNLYDLDHGVLTLAGRIPAGAASSCDDESGPACIVAPNGSFAGPYAWESGSPNSGGARSAYFTQNTISRDGSRVFFTARGTGQIYVREEGTRTTRISASQRTVPDPNGQKPAVFITATPDGSKALFLGCEKLTDDSTAVSTAENVCHPPFGESKQGQDLYSYDVDTGELTDLTVDSNGNPLGAAVQGVLGASEDLSYVYFVADGVLAPGATPGSCGKDPLSGICNLYVSHDGTIKFIARMPRSERENWSQVGHGTADNTRTSRVSADGRALLFESKQSLTGYNNIEARASDCFSALAGDLCREFFRYSAVDEELSCVTCNPTGIRPRGEASLGTTRSVGLKGNTNFTFLTRNVSPDGNRFFFDSKDALLPSDVNGVTDVYEWEAKGEGSCESDSLNGGCLYLISPGNGPDRSFFADASTDGDHVFLFSSQQLVPGDEDELYDVYDAGVGAGLAAQHPLAPPTCSTTACQSNPAPPPDRTPASATFSGPGNAKAGSKGRKCPKGKRKVQRKGKVSCRKAQKQHKRHHNRGGSK